MIAGQIGIFGIGFRPDRQLGKTLIRLYCSESEKIKLNFKKGLKIVVKSTKQMQTNGYRMNVEDSKYLIFESKDHSKKLHRLETMAFDLIDFCEFSEDNEEKTR